MSHTPRTLLVATLRALAALAAALVVFLLLVWGWAPFAQFAYAAGGRPYLRVANHAVMIVLGVSVGAVVMLICSRRDYVTPAIGAVLLFGLGVVGVLMIMVETHNSLDVLYTVADGVIAWLSYAIVVGLFAAVRLRKHEALEP